MTNRSRAISGQEGECATDATDDVRAVLAGSARTVEELRAVHGDDRPLQAGRAIRRALAIARTKAATVEAVFACYAPGPHDDGRLFASDAVALGLGRHSGFARVELTPGPSSIDESTALVAARAVREIAGGRCTVAVAVSIAVDGVNQALVFKAARS